MRKGATTCRIKTSLPLKIVALRNEKGSYNAHLIPKREDVIVALRNEKGSYNCYF